MHTHLPFNFIPMNLAYHTNNKNKFLVLGFLIPWLDWSLELEFGLEWYITYFCFFKLNFEVVINKTTAAVITKLKIGTVLISYSTI